MQGKKFQEKFQNIIKGKKGLKQSLKFLSVFTATVLILYLTSFFYLLPAELLFAFTQLFLFSLANIPAEIISFAEPVIMQLPFTQFQISFLCTGLLELFVLVGAMLASFEVSARKKVYGIVSAALTVYVFNSLRIFLTALLLANENLELVDLAHDILFRVSLFIIIVGFYAVWLAWATGKLQYFKSYFGYIF